MSKFKPGDKIMILAAADWYQPSKRALVGKVQTVAEVESFDGEPFILTNSDEKNAHFWAWGWKLDEVRHATAEEIAAAQKPQPLRWGDLVKYDGDICMVFDERPTDYGERLVVILDDRGRSGYHYAYAEYLTRVGSIRKKIKRIKKRNGG